MKYLQRGLLRIGLCLLLVCSANVAFAQGDQVVGLSDPSTSNSIITFTINLPSELNLPTANAQIQINGVSSNEISVSATGDDNDCPLAFRVVRVSESPPRYQICTDSRPSVIVTLALNDPDRVGTVTVRFIGFSENYMTPIDRVNEENRALKFVINPFIFIRSKVFLEGPLQ